MSLNPLAPAFLPQSFSDTPISLYNSTTMSLPLAHFFAKCLHKSSYLMLLLLINTSLTALFSSQQISLNRTQRFIKPTPGPSTLLSSPLQHHANCLKAIHKTMQQFNQHLEAEHLIRQTVQLIVLQLQNDFALLLFLLFSNKNIAVKHSATSHLLNPNPNPIPNPTSSVLPLPCSDDPKLRRSTPVGAVGPPKAKTNNSANAHFQPTPNTQEVPSLTVQNLTSRICKLEQLFTDEITTYTSTTAGIHSQYIFLFDKIRQLEPGNSDVIIWKIPSVKFVFDSSVKFV